MIRQRKPPIIDHLVLLIDRQNGDAMMGATPRSSHVPALDTRLTEYGQIMIIGQSQHTSLFLGVVENIVNDIDTFTRA